MCVIPHCYVGGAVSGYKYKSVTIGNKERENVAILILISI
jgi:hypothetical protein